MTKKSKTPRPMCWRNLETYLRRNGCADETIAVARLAYSDGVYNGLRMLGETTTAADMVKSWHEFYCVSIADFRDELAKFKAERTKKGGS